MNRKVFIIFVLILLLAVITRFYKLGTAPEGLYLDEAAQGYNAYSILRTGKDEFGKAFPAVFRSFTDFKTPVYIYLIVPLIPIFGLTKFTVRFPSFLFSILTFPVLYYLIKKITPAKYATPLALTTSYLLALSPWHILFGRTNFECNVALFFLLCGIYLFYKGLEKPSYLVYSALLLAIAIPAYHAQRIVTPLMIIILFIKFQKKLLSDLYRKYLIIGSVLAFFILIPTLRVAVTPGFLARASGLNIFSRVHQKPAGFISDCENIFCAIGNNNIYLNAKEFSSLYISYFSPRNMFYLGDYGQRSSFPDLSTFYLWQSPFYLLGIYKLIKKRELKELRFFTLALLLVSPIPAAVTRDPYSTIRSLQMVIPQTIIIALAIVELYFYLQKTRLIKLRLFHFSYLNISVVVIAFVTTVYCLLKLYSSVIILNEYYRAAEWNYGFEDMAKTIQSFGDNIPVVVDNSRTEPYSQLLFFLKTDPATYQAQNFEVSNAEYYTNMNRNKEKRIGNVITRPISWEKDLNVKQYLIGDGLAISESQINEHNLSLVKNIYYPDGSVAFIVTRTNP